MAISTPQGKGNAGVQAAMEEDAEGGDFVITKGPWKGDGNSERCTICGSNGKGKYVCSVQIKQSGPPMLCMFDEEDRQDNINFIITAANSCFAVNKQNPLAVAQALPEMVEALREFVKYFDCNSVHQFKIYNKAKAALQKAGVE